MEWKKLGPVWAPNGERPWSKTHAQLPVVQAVAPDRWWVYVSTRDAAGKSRIGRLVLDVGGLASGELPRVLQLEPEPVLPLGEPGTFDDSGMMPSWLLSDGNNVWLYYIGWNVRATVPYHLSIGLAISEDGGATFRRHSQGPIVDRTAEEPFFATAPCVLRDGDRWRMWYVSCRGWDLIAERWEPYYYVKYAESRDGFHWEFTGQSCIDAARGDGIGRPCVFRRGDRLAMLYSSRSMTGYRTDPHQSYRFGYAESVDGIQWQRMDDRAGIEKSASGWDAQMIEYCWVERVGDETYLLYNGNGFGQSGFGLARLIAAD